jgi:hypothetical protein
MSLLVDVAELEVLLKQEAGTLSNDEYTTLIMEGASAVVRDTAGQPNWVLEVVSAPPDVLAPARARFIALYLAKRAWEDEGNLSRRTTGPISFTFREDGVYGLNLEPAEREWLVGHRPDGGGGIFIMRHRGTTASRLPFGDETPDGYSFAAGDLDFAHGMTMSGPARADNW